MPRSAKGSDERLDPVRWRAPSRGSLLRLGAAAVLLSTAAAVAWSQPATCASTAPDAPSPAASGDIGPEGTSTGSRTSLTGSDNADGTSTEAGAISTDSGNAPTDSGGASAASNGAGGTSTGSGDDSTGSGAVLTGSEATGTRPDPAPVIPEGHVGVPIRLADPTALSVVRPGHRVDLLRLSDTDGGANTPIAESVLVLDVTGADDPVLGGLLLALDPERARTALSSPGRGFAVLIKPSA
ncbi:hypothetical protein Acsp01_37300 [Actinoplanes sp. NBRC 101535]|nr:hypothetical protein Acsp01_37300 [Actinoplanes sp. NBRC 101535]